MAPVERYVIHRLRYYVATVGEHGNEAVISKYVREQGQEKEYKKLYQTVLEPKQLSLWDYM